MYSYELLDSGEGEKLERIGDVVIRRPDPEALWHKSLVAEAEDNLWLQADLSFDRVDAKTGSWRKKVGSKIPDAWQIDHGGLLFIIRPTSFKHVGIFPEQKSNWEYIHETIANAKKRGRDEISVLNLFAYTGGATLAAAKAGATVTHVDASKPVVDWAKENAAINKIDKQAIRWLVDDVLAFAKREVKRGKKYDAIVMDPPAFGRGPDGETWKIEEHFLELFDTCRELLSDKPIFFIVSGYASGYSALAFGNTLAPLKEVYGGKIETLELILKESSPRGASLPAGVTARWSFTV